MRFFYPFLPRGKKTSFLIRYVSIIDRVVARDALVSSPPPRGETTRTTTTTPLLFREERRENERESRVKVVFSLRIVFNSCAGRRREEWKRRRWNRRSDKDEEEEFGSRYDQRGDDDDDDDDDDDGFRVRRGGVVSRGRNERDVGVCPTGCRFKFYRFDSLPRAERRRGGEHAEREESVFVREEREERGGLRDVRADWRVYSVERGVSGGMIF